MNDVCCILVTFHLTIKSFNITIVCDFPWQIFHHCSDSDSDPDQNKQLVQKYYLTQNNENFFFLLHLNEQTTLIEILIS